MSSPRFPRYRKAPTVPAHRRDHLRRGADPVPGTGTGTGTVRHLDNRAAPGLRGGTATTPAITEGGRAT
ncbi:hypothetical protein [Amycolatopsis sp. cmx-4-61]|uniref:hypothetical protein n=1 Tax=Amycolatopsis sp. cmx-4-61 TaxID=2790937 RepID=UPI00397B5A0E